MKKKLPVLLGILFVAVFIGAMIYTSAGNATFRCEVCITYNGRTACGNGAGAKQTEAERMATDISCSQLTAGMTELMQCQNSPTKKITWKQ
jgi:hypothetical protein